MTAFLPAIGAVLVAAFTINFGRPRAGRVEATSPGASHFGATGGGSAYQPGSFPEHGPELP